MINKKLMYLNKIKQQARKAGYYELDPVEYDHESLFNGQVVEVALCHILGIYQRYVKNIYKFNIVCTEKLDALGCDILLETIYGKIFVQVKHTSRKYGRDCIPGTFVVPVNQTGYWILNGLLKFYHIPIPYIEDFEYMVEEINYVWNKYTSYMYKK